MLTISALKLNRKINSLRYNNNKSFFSNKITNSTSTIPLVTSKIQHNSLGKENVNDNLMKWLDDNHVFSPHVTISFDKKGLRGLRALTDIPRNAIISVIPSSLVLNQQFLDRIPNKEMFEKIPVEFGSIKVHLQLAMILFIFSFDRHNLFRPYIESIPFCSNNNVFLKKDELPILLKDYPKDLRDNFIKNCQAFQAYLLKTIKSVEMEAVFETLSEFHKIPLNDVTDRFYWCVSHSFSRTIMKKMYAEDQEDSDSSVKTVKNIIKKRERRQKQLDDSMLPSSIMNVDKEDETSQELCFMPLVDLINYPRDSLESPNVQYDSMQLAHLRAGDRKMIVEAMEAAGLDKAQLEKLGDDIIVLSATDYIEKGDFLLLDYLHYYEDEIPQPEKALEILWNYGFLPPKKL